MDIYAQRKSKRLVSIQMIHARVMKHLHKHDFQISCLEPHDNSNKLGAYQG